MISVVVPFVKHSTNLPESETQVTVQIIILLEPAKIDSHVQRTVYQAINF